MQALYLALEPLTSYISTCDLVKDGVFVELFSRFPRQPPHRATLQEDVQKHQKFRVCDLPVADEEDDFLAAYTRQPHDSLEILAKMRERVALTERGGDCDVSVDKCCKADNGSLAEAWLSTEDNVTSR